MKLFNFIQKKLPTDRTPEQIIRHLLEYLPADYNERRQFKNCVEFLEQREWGLALDSFIELTKETGHYFPDKFWLDLAEAADKMKKVKEAGFCLKQINKTERDLKFKVSFGSTVDKIDDTHFKEYISERTKDEWARERRNKDKVDKLIDQDGVHFKSHGRNGFFYYVDHRKVTEIEYELGVNGLIIWFDSTEHWAIPKKIPLTKDEKSKIKIDIERWAERTRNAIEVS